MVYGGRNNILTADFLFKKGSGSNAGDLMPTEPHPYIHLDLNIAAHRQSRPLTWESKRHVMYDTDISPLRILLDFHNGASISSFHHFRHHARWKFLMNQ